MEVDAEETTEWRLKMRRMIFMSPSVSKTISIPAFELFIWHLLHSKASGVYWRRRKRAPGVERPVRISTNCAVRENDLVLYQRSCNVVWYRDQAIRIQVYSAGKRVVESIVILKRVETAAFSYEIWWRIKYEYSGLRSTLTLKLLRPDDSRNFKRPFAESAHECRISSGCWKPF